MKNNKLATIPKYLFLLSAIAIVLSWLIPNHYPPWTAFYNEFAAAIALLLVTTAAVVDGSSQRQWTITPPAIVLGVVALLPLLQLTFGLIHFSGDAWLTTLYLVGLLFAYLTGHRLATVYGQEKITLYIASIFVVGGCISIFLILHQWLRTGQLGIWLVDLAPGDRPYANLAQPNQLATLFCFALAALLYLYEKIAFSRIIFYLLTTLLLFGISLTGSRTAIVILVTLITWLVISKKKLPIKTSIPELAAGSLLFIFFISTTPSLTELLYLDSQRDVLGRLAESSGDIRLSIWGGLLDAAIQNPLFGYGWNQVSYAQVATAAEHSQTITAQYSHNLFIDLILWNGLFIGGLLSLALIWWGISRIRQCASIEGWFSLSVIVAVGVHALLEFPLHYTYFLLPTGFCAGIIDSKISTPKFQFKRPVIAGLVLVGWLCMALVLPEYQLVRKDFTLMRFEQVGIEIKLPPSNGYDSPLFNQLTEVTRYARTQATENMSNAELQWMENIAHRYPYSPSLMRYAIALGLNHRPEEAALELKRLQQMHSPEHIREAIQGWQYMAKEYRQLLLVELPDIPTATTSNDNASSQRPPVAGEQ